MPIAHCPALAAFSPDKMAKVKLFENRRFFCDLYCLRPGQAQKPHDHAGQEKIYYVVSGEVTFQDDGTEVPGLPGDALWAPAGTVHGVHNPGPGDAVLLVFMAPHPSPEKFAGMPPEIP
jgi:quercetin dioxygenase-like cupin family protein